MRLPGAFLDIQLTQHLGPMLILGHGGTEVTCDGIPRLLTIVIAGDNGLFKGGKAANLTYTVAGTLLVLGRLLRACIDRDHANRIGYQAIHEAIWLGQGTRRYHDTIRAPSAHRRQRRHHCPSARPTGGTPRSPDSLSER